MTSTVLRSTAAAGRPARSPWLRALLAALPAQAQYKVIGADGKVTYTDRAPNPAEGRVTALGARNAPVGRSRAAVRAAPGREPLPGHAVHRRPAPASPANRAARCCASAASRTPKAGHQRRGQRRAREAVRRTRAPTLTIGSQIVRGMSPRPVELVPRRRRLPARVAAAGELRVPAADADRRAPRSMPPQRGRRGAARRRPSPLERAPATTRRHPLLEVLEHSAAAPRRARTTLERLGPLQRCARRAR